MDLHQPKPKASVLQTDGFSNSLPNQSSEAVGVEPTDPLGTSCFQDMHHKPLGHASQYLQRSEGVGLEPTDRISPITGLANLRFHQFTQPSI